MNCAPGSCKHGVPARSLSGGNRYLLAGREILVDAIDSHRTRVVERDQDVFGRDIGAEMDRAGRQAKCLAVFLQSAGRRGSSLRPTQIMARLVAFERSVNLNPA